MVIARMDTLLDGGTWNGVALSAGAQAIEQAGSVFHVGTGAVS